MSRLIIVVLGVVGACTFAPAGGANGVASDAAGGGGSGSGSASGSGSGSGMGSGSGSGSAAACPDGDSDGDGVCNSADDWPCGAKPNAPGNFDVVTFGFTMTDNNVELGNHASSLLVVHPSEQFSVSYDYTVIVPCGAGQQCDVQIELGTDAGKQGCGDNLQVDGKPGIIQLGSGGGNANMNLTLATPGVYKILTQPNKATQCGGNTWAGGFTPDDHLTVGLVCVHP